MANSLSSSVMTVILVVVLAMCALLSSNVNAQAPDPSSASSGTPCTADSDCAADGSEFCRVGFCAAYVLEGGWCGGFVPPNNEHRCATGFACTDFPTDPRLADDGNGYCRKQCSENDDCAKGQTCDSDKVCRAPSTISSDDSAPEMEKRVEEVTVLSTTSESADQSAAAPRADLRPLVSASVTQESDSVTLSKTQVVEAAAPLLVTRALVSSSTTY
jgi:hypothetical protein